MGTYLTVKELFNLIEKIEEKAEYLSTHNKNYTKKQYYTILEIKEGLEDFKKIIIMNKK